MKTTDILLPFAVMLAAFALAGCTEYVEPPAVTPTPAAYERSATGSGCRDVKTGEYVDAEKCG